MAAASVLSTAEFDGLYTKLAEKLRQISDDFRAAIQRMLLQHADKIARCSPFQLKKLQKLLQPYSAGDFRIGDVIRKTYLHGNGKMARHLVENTAIKCIVFEQLPAAAQRTLNKGAVDIKCRNQITRVLSHDLTPAQTRRVLSANHPERGILAPDQQNAARFKAPEYYHLAECKRDESNNDLVCRFVLNASYFMARITPKQFRAMTVTALAPKPIKAARTAKPCKKKRAG
jgi:hypothetical protein